MTDAVVNLSENPGLLRVAFPSTRNTQQTTECSKNHATRNATRTQQTGLKALALLALQRDNSRNSAATASINATQQTGDFEWVFVAHPRSEADELRERLVRLADGELLDLDVVESLPEIDVLACAGLSDECLIAYVRALHDGQQLELGKALPEDTARAMCRHCGPVYIHPSIASMAPVLDGWPRILGGACCHVRNRKVLPRPTVTCGACNHFNRDTVNPRDGIGTCRVSADHAVPLFPQSVRKCQAFGVAP
jgi:hypothetical protein